jgi:TonB family protein
MNVKNKHKKFLKLPEYPGGKEAFKKYIKENLKYPQEALDNKIEGVVHLTADINDNGEVMQVTVENGLGFGCDKEATRLIKNINYGSVKNRGVRLKTKKKFRVEFKLPQQGNIKYNLTKNSESNKDNNKEPGEVKKYSYSININR